MSSPTSCPAVAVDGQPCQKVIVGALGFHAGGHIFASDAVWAKLTGDHFDARAAIAGEPFTTHRPEDCPGEPECLTWSRLRPVTPPTVRP